MRLILEGTAPGERTANQTAPRVSVELPFDDLTAWDVVDLLVRPAMLAAGFAESSVREALRGELSEPSDV